MVENTPCGKCHTSRTIYVAPLQSILEENLYSRHFFRTTDKSLRRILQLKNASEKNATNNTPLTWKPYQFSRHRRCLTLNFGDNAYHSHSNRCQPVTTVKHEPRNVAWRVSDSRMTKIRAQLYGMQTQQGILVRGLLVVQKRLGSMLSFLPR